MYRGKNMWSKAHVDRAFAKKPTPEGITEWHTVAEIQEKFGMTLSAIYNLASKEGIPKTKVGKEVRYSKNFTLYCTRTLTVSTASWEWTHEANKQNANKLKSIFISNNSFYLLQLKGCHERHLLTIYAILIKKAVNAWFVGKNIGKKMGSNGAALTIV